MRKKLIGLALLAGVLLIAEIVTIDSTDVVKDSRAVINTNFAELDIWPTRATFWHDESTITVGNGFATSYWTLWDHPYGWSKYQNAAADGDTFTHSFSMKAGTYTLSVLATTGATRGKVDWYIDDVKVVTGQDWYSGSTVGDVTKTASVTVTGNGRHVLKAVINGQHASSSGYLFNATKFWLAPSSDVADVQS
jgi:hypothetical protein